MDFSSVNFIGEPIEVDFKDEPVLQKKTGCPDWFIWKNEKFTVVAVISEWHDYRRRGRMLRNMRPSHAEAAERRGSWGSGQDYYRIQTENDRYFDIYFDRSPGDANHRLGGWYIYRELELNGTIDS